jgi:asparagine synthase (glutamine-hydrolysing)
MAGICGWFTSRNRVEPDPRELERVLGALGGDRAKTQTTRSGDATLGACGGAAQCYRDERLSAAISGSAWLKDEPRIDARDPRFARLVAERFVSRGRDCLHDLGGAFALALFDGHRRQGLIAIDRMGQCSLAYVASDDGLCFASTITALEGLGGRRFEPRPQAIFDYVYFHTIPGPETFFRDVRRVEPGECVEFHGRSAVPFRYWQPAFEEDGPADFEHLRREFRATLEAAVRRATADGARACFLSGGTDSSTIAGLIGTTSGAAARTYSIGFGAAGYDEMAYARIAAKRFATAHTELYLTPEDVVAAIPIIARAYDQPFGNSSAVPAYYCAKRARDDGQHVLLAGDGGDELFGGNQRYADQYLFSLYDRLPERFRRRVLEPWVPRGRESRVGVVRKLASYVAQASVPLPARLQTYNSVVRFGADEIFQPDFVAGVDAERPQRIQDAVYAGARAHSTINRMLALDLKFTLADNDLRKVGRMCEIAGIDVRYPLLDDEVVDFSLRLPPAYKLRGTRLRYFFKRALRDLLPAEIRRKRKHGFGLPFGVWARDHPGLRALTYDTLVQLRRRGIVRPAYIDRLVRGHTDQHAAYFGGEIWVLMMLEQWLQAHALTSAGPVTLAPAAS